MKSDLASLRNRPGGLSEACQDREKQKRGTIKPLATAARDSNDADAVDYYSSGTTGNARPEGPFLSNYASSRVSMISLIISLIVSQQYIVDVRGTGLSLDFSLKELRDVQMTNHDPSSKLMQVLSADCSDEFAETNSILMNMKSNLEEYGRREHLEPINDEMKMHLVSANLVRLGVNLVDEPNIQRTASELDYVMATFWAEFLPLIQRIVTEKPRELNPSIDLAFRCSRYTELMALYKLTTVSPLYTLVWHVFTSELYIHCVRRKLITVDLLQIKPSSAVRQFVDIYLGFPPNYSVIITRNDVSDEKRLYASKLLSSLGLQFNLENSLVTNGPLETAATLVFDTETTPLSLGSSNTILSRQRLVERFRVECMELMDKLSAVWGNMDEVACFMWPNKNDLMEFSNRIKLSARQLVYGSVCGQLAQIIKS